MPILAYPMTRTLRAQTLRRVLCAVLVLTGIGASAVRAEGLSDDLRAELYGGLDLCATFITTRELALFEGLAPLPLVGEDGPDIQGVYSLPSGLLGVRAKRSDYGGPSCKVFVIGYFDDTYKETTLDDDVVRHFDGMLNLQIGDMTFVSENKFYNKVDTNRLVACIGGRKTGISTERNPLTGAGSVTYVRPIRGDVAC